jgi:hypothetical protein
VFVEIISSFLPGATTLTPPPGILKIGTPICVPERDFIVLGKVIGIQVRAALRRVSPLLTPFVARQEAARRSQERHDGTYPGLFWIASKLNCELQHLIVFFVQVAVKIEQKRNCQNYVYGALSLRIGRFIS